MRLITKKEMAAKLSVSVDWIEQAIPKGQVPPPVKLGELIRWVDEVIDKWIREGCPEVKQQESHLESDGLYDGTKTMEEVKKHTLIDALKQTNGNREKAAQLLGIGERTVYRKIKEYKLNSQDWTDDR